jgi:hypothetical protein
MKNILIAIVFLSSSAFAQSEYAVLSKLENNTIQTDKVELVTPQVAVSRGAIPASDARHYKQVFSNQNPQLRQYKVSPQAKVTLLTFPNLTPKTASLETLKQQLEFNERLPSEFFGGDLFALTISSGTITAFSQVNTRAVTGVYQQAVLISKQSTFNPFRLVLDFVNAYSTNREMARIGKTMEDAPGGLYISNTNPALRTFNFAKNGRIKLLKSVGEYINATPADLQAGLNGKNFGWGFDWDTYFQTLISDVSGEVIELEQGYTP